MIDVIVHVVLAVLLGFALGFYAGIRWHPSRHHHPRGGHS